MLVVVRADPGAGQAERGHAEPAEDQAVIDQRVAGDPAEPDRRATSPAAPAPRRTSAGRDNRAPEASPIAGCGRSGRHRRRAPDPRPSRRRIAFGVPEDQPEGHADRGRRPQRLADGAAHVADAVAAHAELLRHHRRGRHDQAHAEDQEGDEQVHAELRGGKGPRPDPAEQEHVGRLDQRLADIGEDERPGERRRRANLVAPGGGGRCRPGRASRGPRRCGVSLQSSL